MDEETIRKRCIELTAGWLLDQGLVGLVHSVYRAAYADGLEKAAKMICPYCNDPEWITYDPEGDHISPHTGNMFVCRSHKIRAQAHAGQEG